MYQQVTIVGNLGNNPEMRFTTSGVPVTSFSVAVNRSWTTAEGERKEKVTWFRVSCWRKLAEVVNEYLSKGRQVLVIGEMEESTPFQGKDGEWRSSLEITAREVKFLGSPTGERLSSNGPVRQEETHVSTDEDIPF